MQELARTWVSESAINRRAWLGSAAAISAGVCAGIGGCRTAPLTGRKQLMLVPETKEMEMGQQAFADVLTEHQVTGDMRHQQIVERVGLRIAAASGRNDYQWECKVVAGDEQNAFCLPGGKIVVYEGILPVCQNEAGLAVVMSHEVAHVLARHGGERMSQSAAVNGVQTAVGYALRKQQQVSRDMVMRAYGLATTYGVILPYSRKHELEADQIGLMLMAQSGYDPTEAPRFWNRFATASKDAKPPEFLSTHPADSRRASDLEKLLPEALQLYSTASNNVGLGEPLS